jgi:steroid delta-isomerase-like uncharacterized protein
MGALRELLERYVEAENQGDIETVASGWAPDVIYVAPLGRFEGREAVTGLYRRSRESFPDRHLRIERVVEEGDWLAWEGTLTGTNTGPLHLPGGRTLPATGKRIEQRFMVVCQVRDGQAEYYRVFLDQLELMRQLGLMPAPVMALGAVLGSVWSQVSPRLRGMRSRGHRGR